MRKIHTREKRKFGLSRNKNWYYFFHPVKRRRPKTFKTEEAANTWASKHGLKQDQYYFKKVKLNKKFQIVMHNGKNKD